MKKILFLIPSLDKGGAEAVLIRIANELRKRDYNIYVVIFEDKIAYEYKGKWELISIDEPASYNPVVKLYRFIKRIRKVKKIKEHIKPNVSISFLEGANIVNVFASSNEKKIVSIHSDRSSLKKRSIYEVIHNMLMKLIYSRANKISVVSQKIAKFLLGLGINAKKIEVIYNPYPTEEIRERAKEDVEDVFEENLCLINVGRLTKAKGQWWLLRLFKELKKDFPDLKLLILGDGELKNYLVNLSKQLSLKTYVWDKDRLHNDYDVFFLGFKKNPFKYISRAKLFVFTSLWEGFPNALVEAMACGVPVISADCRSGPREILAPDTDFLKETYEPEFAKYGILMPVFEDDFVNAKAPLTRTEKMWVDTIRKLLTNEKLLSTYSQLGVKRAYDFHINRIMNKWIEVIENV